MGVDSRRVGVAGASMTIPKDKIRVSISVPKVVWLAMQEVMQSDEDCPYGWPSILATQAFEGYIKASRLYKKYKEEKKLK